MSAAPKIQPDDDRLKLIPGPECPIETITQRVYVFPGNEDAAAARALGLRAVAFNFREADVSELAAYVVAPRDHLYAAGEAYDVAARAREAGAVAAFVVTDLPGFTFATRFADYLNDWGADGFADLAGSLENSIEWHPSMRGPVGALPEIEITTREMEVNDAVLRALSRDPELYRFGHVLATILDEGEAPRGVDYGTDEPIPPQVRPIPPAIIRERITARVRLVKAKRKGDMEELVPAHPPDFCVAAIHSRGSYPGFRPLEGIIQAPAVRRDGSILDRPGYDPATRLFYRPNTRFEPVPKEPTREDAEAAWATLRALVVDFPFRSGVDLALWLAALLTVLARTSFSGPAPLFGFDANCPGVGKTFLVEILAIIATGRSIPRTPYPGDRDGDAEMRKRITSIALAGERLTLIDNIDGPIGGASLDAALTATVWKDRILGKNEMSPELPLNVTWFASGNNLQVKGDMQRRVLFARLDATVENPEDREGFKIPDLESHVRANRGALVVAALTILRAWHVAGRPKRVKPLGSFEGWTRAIADPVAWITGVDPLEARKYLKASDQDANTREALVRGWAELPGSEAGLTCDRALKYLAAPGHDEMFATLRNAIGELSKDGKAMTPQALGGHMRKIEGRVVSGLRLTSTMDRTKLKVWRVEKASAGSAGSPISAPCGTPCMDNVASDNDLGVGAGSAGSNSPLSRARESEISSGVRPETLPATPCTPCKPDPRKAVLREGDRPF